MENIRKQGYTYLKQNLYIALQAETGDRGSGWSVLEKGNINQVSFHYTDDLLNWSKINLKELSDFFREICWSLIENNEEYKRDYMVSNEDYLNDLQKEFGNFSQKHD